METTSSNGNADRIVLFDGVCNLCNSSVQFLLKRDKARRLRYASLQSDAAVQLLKPHNIEEGYLDSILFLDNGMVYFGSDAVLRICRYLKVPWSVFYHFRIIPKWIRDPVYRWIARNRYKWFGKRESCMVPDEGVRELFLETWPV